jgi:hypothetical protein
LLVIPVQLAVTLLAAAGVQLARAPELPAMQRAAAQARALTV